MIRLDFTSPATLKKLAALPAYGWAEALVRRVDPLWKVSADYPVNFRVKLERGSDGCPDCDGRCCGDVGDYEVKHINVEAFNDESACELAEKEMVEKDGFKDWCALSAQPVVCSATVPDKYLKWFDDAAELARGLK